VGGTKILLPASPFLGERMSVRLEFAKSLAIQAGRMLRDAFFSGGFHVERKPDRTLVSEVDRRVERFVRQRIEEVFPEDGIVGEEFGVKEGGEWTWVIDPLDGTGNFVRAVPYFNTSIGIKFGEQYEIGVVYAPIHDLLFWAERGNGAFVNERRLSCPHYDGDIPFVSYCSSRKPEVLDKVVNMFTRLRKHSADVRKLGSTALEISYLTLGKLDVYIGIDIHAWDFAAAVRIAEEAQCPMLFDEHVLVITKKGMDPKQWAVQAGLYE